MSTTRRKLMTTLPLATATALGSTVALSGTAAATDRAAAHPYDVAADHPQAPYGDQVSGAFKNYLRAAPYVGTAGIVAEGGFEEAKQLGYRTVINLNTADEGAIEEDGRVREAGMDYVSIEVATEAPTPAQVESFAGYVDDPANYPILVHCVSSNRVGAMWALYRAANGVPGEIAIQEGRTVGLKPSRERAVRAQLGLQPVAN